MVSRPRPCRIEGQIGRAQQPRLFARHAGQGGDRAPSVRRRRALRRPESASTLSHSTPSGPAGRQVTVAVEPGDVRRRGAAEIDPRFRVVDRFEAQRACAAGRPVRRQRTGPAWTARSACRMVMAPDYNPRAHEGNSEAAVVTLICSRRGLADFSRRGPYRHRLEVSSGRRRQARPLRLRALPGSEGTAAPQLGGIPGRSGVASMRSC